MAALNAMGGAVGGAVPMMNNGVPGNQRALPVDDSQQRARLNTYIYEYFICNEMYDCARALINSEQPVNLLKGSPNQQRDANGNPVDGGGSDDMEDSKEGIDMKRPDDLPAPNLPRESSESCFLFEWWSLFWDMFNAQRGKSESQNAQRYANYTQSRFKQEQQQQMLRAMSQGGMMGMRGQPNGMGMAPNDLARKAMQNNNRNITPQQQMQLIAQQQAKQQQQQQQQMQRDGSDMDGNRQQRPQSPGSAEGAPSPSKRPRLENAPFNAAQGMMPNGRGQGIPGQQGAGPAGNVQPNAQMLLANGINPGNLTAQQFQNFPGQAQGPKALQQYNNNLAQHQQSQMPNKGMPNPNGPQGQGSPMMPNQEGTIVAGYYNAERPNVGPNNGSHALQDYQMQLMLLEQQNKKRLLMARQEQDGLSNRDGSGGPGGPGPNGQAFQGTSPQGARSVNSPNPNDMKRGTPQMNSTGVPSPVPEGQSRGSPGSMGFMPGNIDPNMTPHFYGKVNGMEGGMIGGVPNVMRPPSSHPTAFNANGQPNQQQMMNMQRQQQQQQQQGNVNQQQVPGWPAGPNGTPMMQQASQPGAPTPQPVGTPQQRAMPPPSAPAVAQAANGRTQTSSPQQPAAPPTPSQTTKANPKAKKDTKPKRNTKKAPAPAGVTPAAEGTTEAATPTPATPITPMHSQSFTKNGQGQQQQQNNGQANGAPAAPAVTQPPVIAQPQQPEPVQNGGPFSMEDNFMGGMSLEFANPNMNGDVLQDFDFDSFLHNDGDNADSFAFDTSAFLENEVIAE
ncbi:hypothetical protein V500_10469 [Pseudogymnoascus sp. VKM F-4518 (FW-2643)]|nr:hypothetical protein V500_10469 [Pseudogymnoascus sp. VKM F-4518 (FW-2643)]